MREIHIAIHFYRPKVQDRTNAIDLVKAPVISRCSGIEDALLLMVLLWKSSAYGPFIIETFNASALADTERGLV